MIPSKRVAILQSSYIPWKGFFDIIHDVDLFVFYDDVQFTSRDWRSRNRIVTPNGLLWLTVPAGSDVKRLIKEVELKDDAWQKKHWASIRHAYGKAPFFKIYAPVFEELYLGQRWTSLSAMNQHFITTIARDVLGIQTEFRDSTDYQAEGSKLSRLIDLATKAGATTYISGPAARAYIEPGAFERAGIELVYKDYTGYPEYPQQGNEFEHGVSVVDLIFNTGEAAAEYIWGWRSHAVRAG